MNKTVATFSALLIGANIVCAQTQQTRPQQQPPAIVQPGLVVDPIARVAYVLNAAGRVEAIDVSNGSTRWVSPTTALPLALVGGQLVALTQAARPTNVMELTTLSPSREGARLRASRVALPERVQVTVQESLSSEFLTGARVEGNSVIVSWEFIPHITKGAYSPEDTAPSRIRGTVRYTPATGTLTRVTGVPPVPVGPRANKLSDRERIDADAGTQFVSPDGRYVLVSQQISDDREWNKYRWSLYERGGRKIGETRTHVAFGPFTVVGNQLLYVTEAYERGDDIQPKKLRAVDLTNGREVWSKTILDTKYRGPFPPS